MDRIRSLGGLGALVLFASSLALAGCLGPDLPCADATNVQDVSKAVRLTNATTRAFVATPDAMGSCDTKMIVSYSYMDAEKRAAGLQPSLGITFDTEEGNLFVLPEPVENGGVWRTSIFEAVSKEAKGPYHYQIGVTLGSWPDDGTGAIDVSLMIGYSPYKPPKE